MLVGLMVIRATCSHVVAFTDVPGAPTVKPAVPEGWPFAQVRTVTPLQGAVEIRDLASAAAEAWRAEVIAGPAVACTGR
ncbi:hypothetical protein [Nonomuraea sp. NPDC049309]|uniref:hypothetical protein n=1 Tax=Nonomuraea sp. NPDC049309 TaxID=3364350 RepID=UPI0037137E90